MLKDFEAKFEGFELQAPKIPFVSNFTGTWITDEEAVDPKYWSNHLKNTVLFAGGIRTILNDKNELVTNGGRVLAVTGRGESLSSALVQAYEGVKQIAWEGVTYRRDIGQDLLAL